MNSLSSHDALEGGHCYYLPISQREKLRHREASLPGVSPEKRAALGFVYRHPDPGHTWVATLSPTNGAFGSCPQKPTRKCFSGPGLLHQVPRTLCLRWVSHVELSRVMGPWDLTCSH